MSHKTSSDVDFTKQKQAIELHSTADNSNQTIDLINTLLGMKSLIAQFKQQSSEPSQAGTSNNDNKDSRKLIKEIWVKIVRKGPRVKMTMMYRSMPRGMRSRTIMFIKTNRGQMFPKAMIP